MNEQEAYREAVRDQIVNNDRILMQAAKPKQKPQIAWRRVLIPVMTARSRDGLVLRVLLKNALVYATSSPQKPFI